MNKICKGAKVGLLIELIAGLIMVVLIVAGKPIPDLLAWIFVVGMICVISFSVIQLQRGGKS